MKGKALGLIAYIIYEFVIVAGIVYCFITAFNMEFPVNLFMSLLAAQGVVFGTTWGTKAFKNSLNTKEKINMK